MSYLYPHGDPPDPPPPRWCLPRDTGAGTIRDLDAKFRIQYVSDVYKGMQSRLDGYRTAAGAIFLAVIASSLTFDSGFSRLLIDPKLIEDIAKGPVKQAAASGAIIGSGVLVVVIGLVSLWVLARLAAYFAEMTSIIYKIDAANGVWTEGHFLEGAALYPLKFKPRRGTDVALDPRDRPLPGWRDPAIDLYLWITGVLTFAHAAYYVYLVKHLP